MEAMLIFLVMATVVEGLTEYIFADIPRAKPYLKYLALALGVGLCVAYQLDLLLTVLEIEAPVPIVGQLITGLLVGRGANYVNDFSRQWLKRGY